MPAIGLPDKVANDQDRYGYDWTIDSKIGVIKNITIIDNPSNRHELAKWESLANSFMELTSSTFIMNGPTFSVPEFKKAEEVIRGFNNDINMRHETIYDFYNASWRDASIHGETLWRSLIRDKSEFPNIVDLDRIDQRTIREDWQRAEGYRCWIQKVYRDSTNYKSYKTYIKNAVTDPYFWLEYGKQDYIKIPDEPSTTTHIKFFERPPIAAAMTLLLYKIWILFFMRKYSEKHWAPPLVVYVGDPKNNYMPYGKQSLEDALDEAANKATKLRNFAAMAVPGYNKVEAIKTDSAKSSMIYVEYLKHLNEEIMFALFGSMGQRTQGGTYEATSTVLDTTWLRFLHGVRLRFDMALKRFYVHSLLPAHGIMNVKMDDIKIEWPELANVSDKETMEYIKIAAEAGVFNDRDELREACSKVIPLLTKSKASGGGYFPKSTTSDFGGTSSA